MESSSAQRPLKWNAPGKLPALFEEEHATLNRQGRAKAIKPTSYSSPLLEPLLGLRISRTFECAPISTRQTRLPFSLQQGVRRDDQIKLSGKRLLIYIETFKPQIAQSQLLCSLPGKGNRSR